MAVINHYGDENAGGGSRRSPGWYDIRIDSKQRKPASTGTPQLQIQGTILNSDTGEGVGGKMTHFVLLHEKMLWQHMQFLDALGVDYQKVQSPKGDGQVGVSYDDDVLLGRVFRARLYHEEWNGRTRERLTEFQASQYDPHQAGAAQQASQQPAPQQPQQPAPAAPAAQQPAPPQGVAPGAQPPGQPQPQQPAQVPGQGQPPPTGPGWGQQ